MMLCTIFVVVVFLTYLCSEMIRAYVHGYDNVQG